MCILWVCVLADWLEGHIGHKVAPILACGLCSQVSVLETHYCTDSLPCHFFCCLVLHVNNFHCLYSLIHPFIRLCEIFSDRCNEKMANQW